MDWESIAESFRRSGRFGGNIFALVFLAFLIIGMVIYVLSIVYGRH